MAGKKKNQRPKAGTQHRGSTDIPKFDLAKEIMVQQRRISAAKRKRAKPASPQEPKKAEFVSQGPEVRPISHTIGQTSDVPFDQEQIIAEIVARDINRLLQSEGRNRSSAGD